jgi:TolB-like protein/class 3 adenylate cyclase
MESQFKSSAGLSAFLFTDIEGSSVRWLNHRAAMEKAVARHDAIVRRIVSEHGGKIFKAAGDAFYVSFSKPADAANAAIALQRAFLAEDFVAVEGLRVRMAVHFGSAERRGKDFFGPALNRTARLLDLAHGGQILVTASTAEVIQAEREVGATFVKVGASPLDDPAQIVEVHQLVANDLPRDFPPLRRPKNRTGGLATHQAAAGTSGSRRRILAALVLASVIALVALAVIVRSWRGSSANSATSVPNVAAPVIPEKSIAVLPFDNLSKDEDNAFFTNGMQDEILTDLARIADLKVISRSSVMHYKTGVPRDLREIGKALGVAYVLEGSVQRAGGKVRVTAQLIDARSDAHVWAQRYDRDLADVFAIQSEVAEAIAAQLRAKISPAEKVAIVQPPTKDLAAYDLYLRAIQLSDTALGRPTAKEELLEATQLLDAAVARDPSFLLAFVQLAQSHDFIYWNIFDHTDARLSLGEAAVKAAEKLDPRAGETLLARGIHTYWGYRDLATARKQLEAASRVLPNNAKIAFFLGLIDRREGKWESAVRNQRRAQELDPQNRTILLNLWTTLCVLRRYPEAMTLLRNNFVGGSTDEANLFLGLTEFWWTGNLVPYRTAIGVIEAVGPGAARDVAVYSFDLAEWERDPAAAANAFDSIPDEVHYDQDGFPSPKAWFAGRLARLRGDNEAARVAFKQARIEVEQILFAQGETAPVLSRLGTIDAYLGRSEDSIRESKRACEIQPLSRDKIDGPRFVYEFAASYSILGEKDKALEQLALVVSETAGPRYGEVLHGIEWDPLRGDPRFDAVLAKTAPREAIK